MSDAELLDLDIWIAEKFMGWSRIDGPTYGPAWVDKDKQIITREVTSFPSPFMPSFEPAAFALVKREIERRGWEWEARSVWQRNIPNEDDLVFYYFKIYDGGTKINEIYTHHEMLSSVGSRTEELAGCLAVKAAIESLQ